MALMDDDCQTCAQLWEQSATLYAEYVAASDDLKITRKNDVSYARKKDEVRRLDGLKRDAYLQSSLHLQEHRSKMSSLEEVP
jgi:hypothetical protein